MGDIADYTDQPKPVSIEDAVSAHDMVVQDLIKYFGGSQGTPEAVEFMFERKEFGLKKYGVVLHKDNGRDYPKDIADEVGDLVAYLRVFLERHVELYERFGGDYLCILRFFVKLMGNMGELQKVDRA